MAKKLPYRGESEQAVLGCIFLDNKKAPLVFELLQENDFFEQRHIYIYQAMKDLYNQNSTIDYTTIAAILEAKDQLEKVGGIGYLVELANYVTSTDYIESYVDIVAQAAMIREIIEVSQGIANDGLNNTNPDATAFLDYAESKIFALAQRRKTKDLITLNQVLGIVKEKTETNYKQKSSVTGLTTGFTTLDKKINGLQPEEFIVLAARPSMGKSAFAMNIALNVAKKNPNAGVAVFSLEMSNEQLVGRMLSSEANIENSKIRTGFLSPQEWKQFETFSESLERLNIFFDDSSFASVNDMRAKCRKLAQANKLHLIVIDYLQLIKEDESGDKGRQNQVAKISRSLKQMAREFKVPVIALSQLSRDVEKREDKKPILADLRESGSIEQDADIVMFLYRDEYYKKGENPTIGEAEIIIAKNRQGSLGEVKFIFAAPFSRFTEKSTMRDEDVS